MFCVCVCVSLLSKSKNIRETLKEQMKYKDLQNKMDSEKKIIEYKNAALQDSISLNEAKQKMIEKKKFLRTFRDENKQVHFLKWYFNLKKKHTMWHTLGIFQLN